MHLQILESAQIRLIMKNRTVVANMEQYPDIREQHHAT